MVRLKSASRRVRSRHHAEEQLLDLAFDSKDALCDGLYLQINKVVMRYYALNSKGVQGRTNRHLKYTYLSYIREITTTLRKIMSSRRRASQLLALL